MNDDERRSLLHLALIPGIGSQLQRRLLDHFDSATKVLHASPAQLMSVPGIGAKLSRSIVDGRSEINPDDEIRRCENAGLDLVFDGDESYPTPLEEIPDPPLLLFRRGQLITQDRLAVGIVGTRHATSYGLAQAKRLAGELSRAGFTIVSGLARGVDAAAHQGAIQAGGRTLAVLGGGLLEIYPPEHKDLAQEVADHGALLSEMPTTSVPKQGSFPRRNRLISGLSLGVIVVEASERSGALITARHAVEQNREVFAVPGRVDQRTSRGCHRLLKEGARLVESADDVLAELGPLAEATPVEDGRTVHHPAEFQLNDLERQILDAIDVQPTNIDDIVAVTGLNVAQVLSTISVLEMRRLIRRVSGQTVVRL